jgi:serine/threonine protein kinase
MSDHENFEDEYGNYSLQYKIGEGAFGSVFQATPKSNTQKCT